MLISGASGFVGSYVIPLLIENGADVYALDTAAGFSSGNLKEFERRMTMLEGDITNFSDLQSIQKRVDYIIHLAAIAAPRQCDDHPAKAFDVNVRGTFNVLKFAAQCHARKFLFASTAHVYGISPKYMPTDERHPLALQDTYTTTKIIGESLCQLFYGNHNLAYTSVRLFNSYWPRQSLDYFIPSMIKQGYEGKILLRGRNVTKDFVYITDVADAYLRALLSDYIGEINIGSGAQTSLETVARYIAKALGAELAFAETQDKGPTYMQSDVSRAKTVLGWNPSTPLETGLDQTIKSFKRP